MKKLIFLFFLSLSFGAFALDTNRYDPSKQVSDVNPSPSSEYDHYGTQQYLAKNGETVSVGATIDVTIIYE